ncbi:MAG: NAD(P)H-hydrate dehydratase [Bacteroidetes bacterium]|nr:NAD(P)H-hydrate dehydratase [Bacteroidota bacterium]
MKILPVHLIREADAYTVKHEFIADIDLMERAAGTCAEWLIENIGFDRKIMIFCGSGNNGGDGLAIARLLFLTGYDLQVFNLASPEKMSPSCLINFNRLKENHQKCRICDLSSFSSEGEIVLPEINKQTVVIDAIFGSGLTRQPEGVIARVIDHINASGAVIAAIDVPSGLFCDDTVRISGNPSIINADFTLTFSPPKLAFFFPENDRYIGDWRLLDIGISPKFIDTAEVRNFMIEPGDVSRILKRRNKFAHKGNFGHALLICGSTGKMGAAILAAKACIRSGAGLVTAHVPSSAIAILQTAVPEAMLSIDSDNDLFTDVPDLTAYTAIATGPGIGTKSHTAAALKVLIQQTTIPIIFDADAINIIAENKTWLAFLPKGCIFTPHPGEFERLVGKSGNEFERNEMQRNFSFKNHCYVVLKGAHTAITTPDSRCFFNTTGNPGMATAGSGDVLTGIIAGLMAQGYSSLESSLAGVYIHGLAGDSALLSLGYEALIASDIIANLGKSFQQLYGKL